MPRLVADESVMSAATKLASIGGGGTNCAAPLALLNREGATPDTVIFVSDYESWLDEKGNTAGGSYFSRSTTGMYAEWLKLRERNPRAKLVCIDLSPRTTTQTSPSSDVLNVGGFSDDVFDVMHLHASEQLSEGSWLARINEVTY